MVFNTNNFVITVASFLEDIKVAETSIEKSTIARNTYQFIFENKHVINTEKFVIFKETVRNKLEELYYDFNLEWANDYHFLLFNTYLFPVEIVYNNPLEYWGNELEDDYNNPADDGGNELEADYNNEQWNELYDDYEAGYNNPQDEGGNELEAGYNHPHDEDNWVYDG